MLEHFVASRALRRLLLRGKGDSPDAAQARAFAGKLWGSCLKGTCSQLVEGHAAKVPSCPLVSTLCVSLIFSGCSGREVVSLCKVHCCCYDGLSCIVSTLTHTKRSR